MALPCGHRTVRDGAPMTDAEKVEDIESGTCPACMVDLETRTNWVHPYGLCPCCGQRWTVVNGRAGFVIFG